MSEQNSKAAERFAAMALQIEHMNINDISSFGGAAVVIPPSASGLEKPIELLMLDAHGDPAQFLSTLLTRIQLMIRDIEDRQRMTQGFGRG